MSDETKREIAKQIVDKQLETMKKFDASDELSKQEYRTLIEQVAEKVKT